MPHHQGLRIKFISEIPNQPSHQNDPLDLIQNDIFLLLHKNSNFAAVENWSFCTSQKIWANETKKSEKKQTKQLNS